MFAARRARRKGPRPSGVREQPLTSTPQVGATGNVSQYHGGDLMSYLSNAVDTLRGGLRLSFAGLEPAEIRRGLEILGALIRSAVGSGEEAPLPALALV